jgi:hypothetical protein
MRIRVLPILLAAAVALLGFAWDTGSGVEAVAKRKPPAVAKSVDLWATINVCDTPAHPDTIGIRGSMPGLARTATLFMRFRVQYLATTMDGKWHDVSDNADSKWKKVGRLRKRVVEAGQNFTFEPPATGGAHRLRGVVSFKWTRHGKTVEQLKRVTEAGHQSTAGADPAGYSAAVCDIT